MTTDTDWYTKSEPFKDWYKKLWHTGFAHGNDLVLAFRDPDNVATAETALKYAMDKDLVVQHKATPTKEQKFFGIGGIPGYCQAFLNPKYASTVIYGYGPNRESLAGRRIMGYDS